MCWYWSLILGFYVITDQIGNTHAATSTDQETFAEGTINSITVAFYNLSPNKWNEEVLSLFKASVAMEVNTFCTGNNETCGLSSSQPFDDDLVIQNSEAVSNNKKLSVSVYVKLPPGVKSASTVYVLNQNALQETIIQSRVEINKAIGYSIVAVGNAEYSPAPDAMLNWILSITAFACLFVVIVVWIILYCWRKRHDKQNNRKAKAKKDTERRTTKSLAARKIHPAPKGENRNVDKPAEKQATLPPAANYNSPDYTEKKTKAQIQSTNYFREDTDSGMRSMTTSPKPTAVFQANEVNGVNSLASLDGDRKEKKKKKHKKKKSRHFAEDDSKYMNTPYDNQTVDATGESGAEESIPKWAALPDASRVGMRMC